MTDCRVCSTPDEQKPQIFRNTDHCCDRHRKIIAGEIEPTIEELDKITDKELLVDVFGILADEDYDRPIETTPVPKKRRKRTPIRYPEPRLDGNKL